MNVTTRLTHEKHHEKYQQLAEYLKENDNYLVTAHIRADGDAIAAICFVQEALCLMGKKVHGFVSDPAADPKYSFLQGFDKIGSVNDGMPDFQPETAIILDSPTLERIGSGAELALNCTTRICIDHHLDNDDMSPYDIVDTSASSTCEMLARLIPFLDVNISKELAEILYTGIIFDTGNFRFSNTSARAFMTASALVDLGANPEKLNNRIFYDWSMNRARAKALVLQSLTLYRGKRIAITHLPVAFFDSHPGIERDMEGFSDIGVSIKGVRVAAFLKEKEPGVFKISLRATEDFDVASAAGEFGGGGHRKASGCRVEGEYNDVLEKVLDAIQKHNPRLNRRSREDR